MATAREVKRRMKSIKNIRQVTRALEAVSASKVRRATTAVLSSRGYTDKAYEMLISIASSASAGMALHPLLDVPKKQPETITILLITSDRGTAGAYNSNIIRVARHFAAKMGLPVRWVAVGRKGRDILLRAKQNVVAEFSYLPPRPVLADIRPIAQVVIDDYLAGRTDEVFIAYTNFITTLTQRPVIQRLLPLTPMDTKNLPGMDYLKTVTVSTEGRGQQYEYEPDAQAILEEIVPKFTVMVIYQSYLEALASEHSARMVAMHNATDNAGTLIDALQLAYNKARQAGITGEILDIVGGVEALRSQSAP